MSEVTPQSSQESSLYPQSLNGKFSTNQFLALKWKQFQSTLHVLKEGIECIPYCNHGVISLIPLQVTK